MAKEFKLRPTPTKDLPELWQDFIESAGKLAKQGDRLATAVEKNNDTVADRIKPKILSFLQDAESIARDAVFCQIPMPRAFSGQVEVEQLFMAAAMGVMRCLEAVEDIKQCLLDPSKTYEIGVTSVSYEIGVIAEKINIIAKALPRLYTAGQYFTTSIISVDKIGPISIYLEQVDGIFPSSLIEIAIQYIIRATQIVYKRYKNLGISDYALAGPIFYQVGLPPLAHSGLFRKMSNQINITLITLKKDTRKFIIRDIENDFRKNLKLPMSNDRTFTLAHELAHRIYYRGLTQPARDQWKEIYYSTTLTQDQLQFIYYSQRVLASERRVAFKELASVYAEQLQANQTGLNLCRAKLSSEEIAVCQKIIQDKNLEETMDSLASWSVASIWPTEYSKTNASEAFADSLASVILPDFWEEARWNFSFRYVMRGQPVPQMQWGNTPEADRLVRNIIAGVRPVKPRYRRNSVARYSGPVSSDMHCPNLNCYALLSFGYANEWGLLTCPSCRADLILNDVNFPSNWLIVKSTNSRSIMLEE